MFKAGTGWLGWSPEVTMTTPIPQIFLAIEGKMDFVGKTNPFGAAPKRKKRAKSDQTIEQQRAEWALIKADFKRKAKR